MKYLFYFALRNSCKYIDIKGTIHEELADEIMGYARKKFFGSDSDFKFQDLWRFKSRLVEGEVDEDGI
jgi:phytanoyl-CoA hydroxylase